MLLEIEDIFAETHQFDECIGSIESQHRDPHICCHSFSSNLGVLSTCGECIPSSPSRSQVQPQSLSIPSSSSCWPSISLSRSVPTSPLMPSLNSDDMLNTSLTSPFTAAQLTSSLERIEIPLSVRKKKRNGKTLFRKNAPPAETMAVVNRHNKGGGGIAQNNKKQ